MAASLPLPGLQTRSFFTDIAKLEPHAKWNWLHPMASLAGACVRHSEGLGREVQPYRHPAGFRGSSCAEPHTPGPFFYLYFFSPWSVKNFGIPAIWVQVLTLLLEVYGCKLSSLISPNFRDFPGIWMMVTCCVSVCVCVYRWMHGEKPGRVLGVGL